MAEDGATLGGGLVYEDWLRLHWVPAASVDPIATTRRHEANEEFLRAMAVMETHAELDEEHGSVAQALARLELKIRLLTQVVGRVLARQLALPEPVPVRFTTAWIEWRGGRLPALGEEIALELYLRPEYPFPLVLGGRVVNLADDERSVRVDLEELGEGVREWLEKTIFRHHRRAVALSRRSANREDRPD